MNPHAGWGNDGRCVACDSNDPSAPCKKSRPSWDEYFAELARVVATRATCDRLHVGCVLVRDRRVVASGYNGAPSGQAHCDDEGHQVVGGHCRRAVHAEANAVAMAARHGVSVDGCVAYITHEPCNACRLLLLSAGVVDFRWTNSYGSVDG